MLSFVDPHAVQIPDLDFLGGPPAFTFTPAIAPPFSSHGGTSGGSYGGGTFGVANDPMMNLVGTGLAATAEQILRTPYVQQQLAQAQEGCKTQAKQGVGEFLSENWPWFIAAGFVIAFAQYATITIAVAQTLGLDRRGRAARRTRGSR